MRLIIVFLQSVAVLASAFIGLAVLSTFVPLVGVGAAIVVGLVAVIAFFRPLPLLWLRSRFVSAALAAIAIFALIASVQIVVQQQASNELARQAEMERRLVELRNSDAAAYLSELKALKDPRWEAEFKSLDKAGFDKFEAERHAKEEQERKKMIEQYLEKLKSISASDIQGLYDVYYHLSGLDPSNHNYRSKKESLNKQIEEKNKQIEARKNPLSFVTLEKFSWSKGGFDNVMLASFSINNASPLPVKDIEIRCTHSAPSGTTIDQNTRTIYERVEAHKIKRISNFNMGFIHSQASRSNCSVTKVMAIR